MVLFHLFFLLCTTIRQKYMVFFHLSLFLCTTIWPKIKVHTDLFLYMYTTIRPKINVHIDSFFYLHTAIRQKYMIFFLSFILSLCTTIRPKNRVLINLLFLFVHDHLTNLGVNLTLLFILFLDVSIFHLLYSCQIMPLYFRSLFLAVLPLYFVRYIHSSTTYIFRTLYSLESCSYILYALSMAIWRLCRCSAAVPCSGVPGFTACLLQICSIKTDAAVRSCSVKMLLWKNSQNSQWSNYVAVSFW